jgi:hypothetical protein
LLDRVARIGFEAYENQLAKYSYEIGTFQSAFRVGHNGASGIAGMRGRFWLDRKTKDLVRLDVEAVDIPAHVPLSEARKTIWYSRVRIAEKVVLLPQRAEVGIVTFTGEARRNVTQFSHCREYAVESKLILEPVEAEGARPSPAVRPVVLPAGIELVLVLDGAITSSSSVGEMFTAHVTKSSSTLVPAGAKVFGRIRRMDFVEQPRHAWAVGIELSRMEWPGAQAGFFGVMDRLPAGVSESLTVSSTSAESGIAFTRYGAKEETITLPPIPGVRSFLVPGTKFRLEPGLEMRWRTIDPRR